MPQNIWKKLLENKKNQWVILLLVGILLVVIAIPTSSDSGSESETVTETEVWKVTETEERLEQLLGQIQGVGEVHVMMTYQDESQVEGVVVVTECGGNAVMVRKITEVVQALFDVDAHKIKVIESK